LQPEEPEDADTIEALKDHCTVPHPKYKRAVELGLSTKGIPTQALFWLERDGWYGFPRELKLGKGWDHIEDHTVLPERTFRYPCKFVPRDERQRVAVEETWSALQENRGTILDAQAGAGKTVFGAELIRRLGTPTVVLVHKDFLLRQWEREINKFMPKARVGRLRRDRADSGESYDVVMATIQSVIRRDYGAEVFGSFGLLVGDEIHRHGAPEWGKGLARFPAMYRLGVSATLQRKDGLERLVYAGIGGIGHTMPRERPRTRLAVRKIDERVDRKRYFQVWNNKPNMAKLINCLAYNDKRTAVILKDIRGAVESGRKSLVLTDRLDHVAKMVTALALSHVDVAKFVGGMKEHEQERALECQVVIATWPMAQEGLDVPAFDTLFLATPKSGGTALEQGIGRIQREYVDKKEPLVVDYVDHYVPICQGMYRSRTKRYRNLGVVRG